MREKIKHQHRRADGGAGREAVRGVRLPLPEKDINFETAWRSEMPSSKIRAGVESKRSCWNTRAHAAFRRRLRSAIMKSANKINEHLKCAQELSAGGNLNLIRLHTSSSKLEFNEHVRCEKKSIKIAPTAETAAAPRRHRLLCSACARKSLSSAWRRRVHDLFSARHYFKSLLHCSPPLCKTREKKHAICTRE